MDDWQPHVLVGQTCVIPRSRYNNICLKLSWRALLKSHSARVVRLQRACEHMMLKIARHLMLRKLATSAYVSS